jgi:hypothetical protein
MWVASNGMTWAWSTPKRTDMVHSNSSSSGRIGKPTAAAVVAAGNGHWDEAGNGHAALSGKWYPEYSRRTMRIPLLLLLLLSLYSRW